ncbi:hypothetical protein RSAG8_13682, partial [Rhizoctonia solani AG-8 WAC10335]
MRPDCQYSLCSSFLYRTTTPHAYSAVGMVGSAWDSWIRVGMLDKYWV